MFVERRSELLGDWSYGKVSGLTLTVPSGGGLVVKTVAIGSFTPSLNLVDAILNVLITGVNPALGATQGPFSPQAGLSGTSLAIGLTLSAAAGTTLTAEILILGH